MKAIQVQSFGGPEVLEMVDLPTPAPEPAEVVVRVRAAGINRLDILLRDGKVFKVPLPHVPGTDIAGEIVQVGRAVKDWHAGDRVLVAPILSCGECEHCLAGEDNLCSQFGTVGSSIQGGYAEYIRIPARNVVRIPESKSFIEAAAFPLAYATAAAMLRKADLQAGETVLVVGASGGLGHAGIQLAKALGARVIAVVRQHQHVEQTVAIGADVVLQSGPDLVERVKQLTSGLGVDVAFEHVGPATFTASLACLRLDGRLVTAGVTTGTEAPLDLKSVFLKRLSIMGCRGSGQTDLRLVVKLWAEGKIAPRVDYVLPLADAAEAHRIIEQGSRFGKIVLEV